MKTITEQQNMPNLKKTKATPYQNNGQAIVEYVVALSILSVIILSLPYLLELLAKYQGSQASALTAVFL